MDALIEILTQYGYWGMLVAAFLAGILAYSAITAYMNNEAYDPVTGKNVMGGPEHPALQQVAETH